MQLRKLEGYLMILQMRISLYRLSWKLYVKKQLTKKTVRNGGVLMPFISPELQLIGKYIHCSAHWNPVVVKDVWLDGNKVKPSTGQ
jgi:hypothetical protein